MPRKHRILSLVLLALILSQTACGAEQQGTADTDAQTSADDTGTTDETTTAGSNTQMLITAEPSSAYSISISSGICTYTSIRRR